LFDITEKDGGVTFQIRVVPRASRTEICGELEGALKVRVASPPVDGAANADLVKLFAKKLGVAKSAVEIVSGGTSKTKQLRISGVTAAELRKMLV
jgi:uncharacterized protein (TIGR00251 family)